MPGKWIWRLVAALIVVAVAAGVIRALSARKAQQAATAATAARQALPVALDISAQDVVEVLERELDQTLPVSGSLRAMQSAMLKARVAGELQGLNVREGDTVQAGQVLARIDADEYRSRMRQAQQQAQAAQAQVDVARRQFDNNRALAAQGFISPTALESAQSNLQAAEANFRAAQAAAEVSRKSLDDTVLKAPLSGVVSQRLAQAGERVAPDTRLLEIIDPTRLELEAAFSPAESLEVRVGQRAQLSPEGLTAPVVMATVARINPATQAGSRSVLAYLALEKAGQATLRQGLFMQGKLHTGTLRALAVPLDAVRTDKPQPYVQWLDGDQVRHQPVTPGARGEAAGESWVAITELPARTRVLRGAVGVLREGTVLRLPEATVPPQPATAPAPAASTPSAAAH